VADNSNFPAICLHLVQQLAFWVGRKDFCEELLSEGVSPCLDVGNCLQSGWEGVADYIDDGASVVVSEVDLHFGRDYPLSFRQE